MLPSPDGVWPIKNRSSGNDPLHLSSQSTFWESGMCSTSQLPGKAKCLFIKHFADVYWSTSVLAGEWKVQRKQFRC